MSWFIDAACTGCTACARQCPTAAIRGARGALHVIDAELCVDCGVCGMICPDAAVYDAAGRLAPRLPRPARPRPEFHPDLCNGCGLCVGFCPFDCLAVEGRPYLGLALLRHPDRCVSCGECAVICIKGAVRMAAPAPTHPRSEAP